MKHNRNIDNFRSLALLQILIYHAWVKVGSPNVPNSILFGFVQLSGEIGVTAFFALSGFGMYCSIDFLHTNGEFNYAKYLSKRAKRILPAYYFCLAVTILVCEGNFISANGIKHVVTHLLLIHNFFPSCHGSINGGLWTIGVIVQFYLIAPLLWKMFKKNGWISLLFTIGLTIGTKTLVYLIMFHKMDISGGWYAFYAGRQLITALDNFSVGMFAAWFVKEYHFTWKRRGAYSLVAVGFVAQLCLCEFGLLHGIHSNNFSGYTWHSFVAISIALIMIGLSYAPELNGDTDAILQFLAKNEYVIYLWHLLVYDNLIQRSEFFVRYAGSALSVGLLILAAILAGVVLSRATIDIDVFRRRKCSK